MDQAQRIHRANHSPRPFINSLVDPLRLIHPTTACPVHGSWAVSAAPIGVARNDAMALSQTKKNPGKPGFFQSEGLSLNDLNVRSLFTFGSRRYVERDFLVLFERLEAGRLNRREMREKIVATAIGSDKAKTFSVVKPFNRTC